MKIKRKKISIVLFCLIFIIILSACNSNSEGDADENKDSSDGSIVLNYASDQGKDHFNNKAAQWMADEIEEKTDGEVQMKLHLDGSLGDSDEMIDGLSKGDIDLLWDTESQWARYIDQMSLLSVSYLVEDDDHFKRIADPEGEVMKYMGELFEENDTGARLVGMMGGGTRSLYNSVRPVETPSDLEGLNVRVQDSSVVAEAWKLKGANPEPLAWSEVYTALQSQVIDGAETSVSTYDTDKLYEVAPYFSHTDHQYVYGFLTLSEKTYQELPEDLREIVIDTAEEASEKAWESYWNEAEELEEKLIEEEGVEFNDVDTSQFEEKVQPLINKVAKEKDAEKLLELIEEEEE